MLTAVAGVNWGDEGKGRMIDLLAERYDVICRYQGGNNAGHTIVNDKGKFVLNLLPSGVLRDGTINVLGGGMVIDIEHLSGEITALKEKGIKLSPDNLKISDKAFICMPYHKRQDIYEENRLKDKKYGSTRRGIAPVYGDKYMKKGLRICDLINLKTLNQKLAELIEWKNFILKSYDTDIINLNDTMQWLEKYGTPLKPYITDTTEYLSNSISNGKHILFEAQLGALRDIDYGIYPYTTSSQTLAAYAPIGAGIPWAKLDNVIGTMKAYSSCVGEGPFTAEVFGDDASTLRAAGAEIGAATGRPRRVGWFDCVASRYGARIQGATELALTKLDVLSYLDMIPVCVAYKINGEKTERFPSYNALVDARPVFECLEGFKTDISKCRNAKDLPKNALKYVQFIEEAVGCPIKYVSVGAKRDDYLSMR